MHPLERHRLAAGLTQAELAEKIGTSRVNISRWENGHVTPSAEVFPKLAEALGITALEATRLIAPDDAKPGSASA